ncbi:MAG: 4-hydroxy-tetrahydrodipicolinate synthase [Gammaproteobacteria bacterium]|nr:4-hydroxy-tetrahydrodipicolinate synthase [Gammaproteobacteria bacterium]|tara:strand:+ start:49332 stop:50210 length:879 start_codon:yes stop_codon:yes gene_type:complete
MIKGSIVALVTPMTESGELDLPTLNDLLEWHIQEGTDAIVAVGTTGESPTLSIEENCAVVDHVVKTVKGRVPVIAGTGANSTQEAIEMTAAAKESGADACLLVTPYYNKPTQKGLIAHHTAIAEAVDIPQILYNVPGRTACDMLPTTVRELSKVDNIIAIKEATGDLVRGKEVIDLCKSDSFAIYSGDDPTAMDLMLMGAEGTISVTANVVPKLFHELCELTMAGERKAAGDINLQLSVLNKCLFLESNPIPVKWALYKMGKISPGIRLPLTQLDELYHEFIQLTLQRLELV